MSTKELAYSMIDNLTEEQLNALIVILQGLQKDEPNEETKKVLDEAKESCWSVWLGRRALGESECLK